MWPFRRRRKPDEDWELRLARMERAFKEIQVEWDDWYGKYRRLYARLAKRVKEAEAEAPESHQDARSEGGRLSMTPRITNPLARRLIAGYNGEE